MVFKEKRRCSKCGVEKEISLFKRYGYEYDKMCKQCRVKIRMKKNGQVEKKIEYEVDENLILTNDNDLDGFFDF
jgi:hypothetical protein